MVTYKKFLVVAPDMYAADNYIRGSFDTKAEAEVFAESEADRTHTDHFVRDQSDLDPNNNMYSDKDYIREMRLNTKGAPMRNDHSDLPSFVKVIPDQDLYIEQHKCPVCEKLFEVLASIKRGLPIDVDDYTENDHLVSEKARSYSRNHFYVNSFKQNKQTIIDIVCSSECHFKY